MAIASCFRIIAVIFIKGISLFIKGISLRFEPRA